MHFSISRLAANNPLTGFCHNAIGQFNVVCDMQSCRTRCRGFSTSRLCISAGRAGMIGDLSGYSYAKRGASPLRLPACRAGQQCVSPPSCRPGPQSSRSGQCFPRSRTKRPSQEGPPPLVLSYCCFLSWRLLRHQFENRDVRLVSHQLLGVGDHATRRQGRTVPWW